MFEDILKISLAILALTRRDAGKHWRAFLFLLQLLKVIAHRPQAFPRNSLIGLVDVVRWSGTGNVFDTIL